MAVHEIAGSSRSDANGPVGRRLCIRLLVALIAVVLLLVCVSSETNAANKQGNNKRRHSNSRSRHAAAAAKARKTQQIHNIQRQVANARQVLATAESTSAMSQSKVNQALAKLSGIRNEIENAEDDVVQALKTQRAIEAEILAEQPHDSELATVQAAVTQAKDNLHRAIHRVLRLPDDGDKSVDRARLADLAKLSNAQRNALEADANYQSARQDLKDTAARADWLRQELFHADPDWVAAQRDLSDARQREHAGSKRAKTTGLSSLGDRQDLRQARHVVTAARAIIAQGEARLRKLGAKPTANSGASRPAKSQSKKK